MSETAGTAGPLTAEQILGAAEDALRRYGPGLRPVIPTTTGLDLVAPAE